MKDINWVKKEVIIGKNVWIGNKVTILKGVRIGGNYVIAAGSVILGKGYLANAIIGEILQGF